MAELNYYVTSVETPTISDGTYGNYGGTITIAPSGSYGASEDEDFQLQTEYVLWIHARAGYTVSAENFSYQGATPYAYGTPQAPDFFLYQEWNGDPPEDAIVPVFPEINGTTAIKSVSFQDTPYATFEELMEWELAEQGITEDNELYDSQIATAVVADGYVFAQNPGIGNKIKVIVKLHEGWQMPAEDVVIDVDIDGFAEIYVDESDVDFDLVAEDPEGPGHPIDPDWDWDDYDVDGDDDEGDINVDVDVTYADNEDEDTEEDGDTLNEDGDGDDLGDEPDDTDDTDDTGIEDTGEDDLIAQDESDLGTSTITYMNVEASLQGVFAVFGFSQSQVDQPAPGIKHKYIFDGMSREAGDIITITYSIHLKSTPLFVNVWPGNSTWVTTIIGGEEFDDNLFQGNSATITREYIATEDDYDEKIHIKFKEPGQQPLAGGAEFAIWNMSVLVKDQFDNTKKYYVADFTQLHDSSGELVEELSTENPNLPGALIPVQVSGPNGTNPNIDQWRAGGVNDNMSYKVYTSETTGTYTWFMDN